MKETSVWSGASSQSSWLDQQCDHFETAWRQGSNPRIEDLLAEAPAEVRNTLLQELLSTELELRRKRGDDVRRDEYASRFPDQIQLLDELLPSHSSLADPTQSVTDQGTEPHAVSTSVRYAELRFFQRGGLGALYRAKDQELHREAVVKFVGDKYLDDPDLLSQFKIEAEITSRLDHPGVVPVYGIGQDWNGRPFYVMRLIRGRELRQSIQEYHQAGGPTLRGGENRQRLFSLLEHLISAANTVAYAHDVGIVHCDIKPANIMIGKYGETFLLDWGLATSFQRTSTFLTPNEPTMRPRSVPEGTGSSRHRGGTYGYISPEQLTSAESITPSCDIYSLGATLYEILAGKPPFSGRDPDVAEQIKAGRFRPPREVKRKISRRLEAICLKAMSLSPEARFRTAKEFAADLQNWMRDDEVQAAPDRWAGRTARFARRHRGVTLATFVTTIVVAMAGVWTLLTLKNVANESKLRQLAESNLDLAKSNLDLAASNLDTALNTFEDLCRPMANGELNNLSVFEPFTDRMESFVEEYLKNYEDKSSMLSYTGRMYELRATVARISSSNVQPLDDYRRAQKIYEDLRKKEPSNTDYKLRLAQNYVGQGQLLLNNNNLKEAKKVLTKAQKEFEELLTPGPKKAANLKRGLAETYHCLGVMYLKGSFGADPEQLEKAQEFFEKSQDLCSKLWAEAGKAEKANYSRDLARCHAYLLTFRTFV